MDVATAQARAAAILSGLGGSVRTEPVTSPRAGDGWVLIGRVTPGSTLTTFDVVLTGVLVLGSDQRAAAVLLRTLPTNVVRALTTGELHPQDVSVEPAELPAGEVASGPMYALIVTLTVEVDS